MGSLYQQNMVSGMVGFALAKFEDLLLQAGLYETVRAIQNGILQSTQHFYTILERYNPETYTFFTPIGEMGIALHEMYEVSRLGIGDTPYEENVPSTEELYLLRRAILWCTRPIWRCCATFRSVGR